MSSNLLSIGASGARAAQVALDVTSQNIANASTAGYVRRSTELAEVAATGYFGTIKDVSLSGVRVAKVVRNADAFRQAEVRRTGSDTARASSEVDGLTNISNALEQANTYTAITTFQAALQKLKENPTDSSLRASVIESARTMVDTFQIAGQELDAVGNGLQSSVKDGISQVNTLAGELARTNLRLTRAADASSDQTALLDQRDQLLSQLSQYANLGTTFASDGSVAVTIGGTSGPSLVTGGTAVAVAATFDATAGTVTFDAGGTPLSLSGGSLAGQQAALTKLAQIHGDLNTLAGDIVTTVNHAQSTGVDLAGAPGANLLSGSDTTTIALTTSNGSKIATAPATAGPGSRDTANLDAMRAALATTNPAGRMDGILFDISSTVASRTVTRDALKTISDSASTSLSAEAGVDLNTEAVNLVRFQQAFQASGKVMQVATTLFDTLLNIR
ncbi:flagellar hook-associated protein FlgK [Novosphingobium sp.]|uniref:flagellar hook-associated protein FlgK n=1 Tax=Novosphingobium sp. TaxID=1874826 RepID=UPI0038B91FB4